MFPFNFSQPAYHSKKNEEGYPETCSCAICPLKTDFRGPAEPADPGRLIKLDNRIINLIFSILLCYLEKDDIIDEVLMYFRANVLFRNYDVRGGADKTLIYLTLHAVQCLVKLEKIEDKNAGKNQYFLDFVNFFADLCYPCILAVRELKALSTKPFAIPGEPGFPLGGLFPTPTTKAEGGTVYIHHNILLPIASLTRVSFYLYHIY